MIAIFEKKDSNYFLKEEKGCKTELARSIIQTVREHYPSSLNEKELAWHISADDLIKTRVKNKLNTEINNPVIITDIFNIYFNYENNPKTIEKKLLKGLLYSEFFIISDIWGYSSNNWTPLMLRMEKIYQGTNQEVMEILNKKPLIIKKNINHEIVYEFMYLQKDHTDSKTGKYDFGMVGKYNAAILYKDAMSYFLSNIKYV